MRGVHGAERANTEDYKQNTAERNVADSQRPRQRLLQHAFFDKEADHAEKPDAKQYEAGITEPMRREAQGQKPAEFPA